MSLLSLSKEGKFYFRIGSKKSYKDGPGTKENELQRTSSLNLTNLETKRIQGDLIEILKIVKGLDQANWYVPLFFKNNQENSFCSTLRCHEFSIESKWVKIKNLLVLNTKYEIYLKDEHSLLKNKKGKIFSNIYFLIKDKLCETKKLN